MDEYELQDFLEETMDGEFRTQLEDNSAIILSRLLLGYRKMYKNGQTGELNADLAQRFPPKATSNVAASVKRKNENDMEDVAEFIFIIILINGILKKKGINFFLFN